MAIVIDASVIIAVIAGEPERDYLVDLTQGAKLITPLPVRWEIGNAFSAMLKRQRIGLAQVLDALEIYSTIPIRFVEVELEQSLKIADELHIYAYDAYLIRCAQKYHAPLLSLDKSLVALARSMQIEILEYS
ncbi:MAG: PIN domain-containing protein [Chloroflexi bacterium]|nr:PIN domain-containing protein [Chloroflexota bacterium]